MINRKSRNSQRVVASKMMMNMAGIAPTNGKMGKVHRNLIYKRTNKSKLYNFQMKRITNISNKISLGKYNKPFEINEKKENFIFNKNTPYSTIFLSNDSFNEGTVRITVPGKYILTENIVFHPNSDNDFQPTNQQIKSGQYPMGIDGAYHLGFFAAIAIESDDVILDLNKKTIEQSKLHNLQQRFYANIELASSPFIPKQGPAPLSNKTNFKSPDNVIIMNGTLGLSSHHGIHGNSMRQIQIKNIEIKDFEVAGIALNGCEDGSLENINISGASQNIQVVSTYSQLRFIRPFLHKIKKDHPNAFLKIKNKHKTVDEMIMDIDLALENAKSDVMSGKKIANKLLRNESGLYDGCVYGLVLNVNGVVINDFIKKRTFETLGNKNLFLKNININNIVSEPLEIIGVNPEREKDPIIEKTRSAKAEKIPAYGGKTQVGPVGDVFQITNSIKNGKYKENILSNGQLIISKYNDKNNKYGTANISKPILDWVENDMDINDVLNDDIYFTSGGDSMGHVMKGNIGLFISAGEDITVHDFKINNVISKGNHVGTSSYLKEQDRIRKGGDAYGCCVTGSKNIVFKNEQTTNIISENCTNLTSKTINSLITHI
jgi:hypothetical protein